jgi:hypothetical protein
MDGLLSLRAATATCLCLIWEYDPKPLATDPSAHPVYGAALGATFADLDR